MKGLLTKILTLVVTGGVAVSAIAADSYVERITTRRSVPSRSSETLSPAQEKVANMVKMLPKLRNRRGTGGITQYAKTFMPAPQQPRRASAPMAAPTNMPNMCGLMAYSELWDEMSAFGVYTVPTNSKESFVEVFPTDESYAGVALDGVYYTTDYMNISGFLFLSVGGYDLATGEKIYSYDPQGFDCVPLCLAADERNHEIYGVFYNSEGMGIEFGTIVYDEDSYTRTTIGELDYKDGMWNSLAVSGNGTIYGIRTKVDGQGTTLKSELCKIDRQTAEVTVVGDTGELPQYASSAIIDPNTDRMYWTVCPADNTSWLCEVNLGTGQATQIYQFPNGEQIVGLYLTTTGINIQAPGDLKAMAVDFKDDSLSGTVNVTAPMLLYNGLPGIGKVTVKVELDGEVVGEATGNYGAKFSIPVTVDKPGSYTFLAYAENNDGAGPKSMVHCPWIGVDTPMNPAEVTAKYADGKMTLTWSSVADSQHDGYINAADITYDIYDALGNEVARGLKQTSYTFDVPEPADLTIYSYVVKAVYDGNASSGTLSNNIVLGTVTPPYAPDFANEKFGGWTIIDGDGDGRTWDVDTDKKAVFTRSCWTAKADDWMITPPVHMEAGKSYALAFDLWSLGRSFTERIEVMIGKENTKEAMTTVVLEPMTFNNGTYESDRIRIERQIPIDETGTYYIGFHACSDMAQYGMFVSNMTLGEGVSVLAPGQVENAAAVPDPDGDTKVTVKFTTPTKTMNGQDLKALTKVEVIRDGELVHTFEAPGVGKELSFEDVLKAEGQVHYTIAPYNEYGKGIQALMNTWVGIGRPSAAPNPTIARTANVGEVALTWDPITSNNRGVAINPDKVTYNIHRTPVNDNSLVKEGVVGTSYTYNAVGANDQEFVQCCIYGQTTAGQGSPSYTDMIPVGKPYAGMEESGNVDYIIATENSDDAEWAIQDDKYDDGNMKSQDGDDAFFCCYGKSKEAVASIYTGLISLKNMTNPGLSFFLFNNYDAEKDIVNANEFTVEALPEGSNEWVMVGTGTIDALCNSVRDAWSQVSYSLKDFMGQTIQLRFTAKTMTFTSTAIDNIRVSNLLTHDMKAAEFETPDKATCGQSFQASVKLANHGTEPAKNYTVEVYADDKLVDSKPGIELASGAAGVMDFSVPMSPAQTKSLDVYAKVVMEGDEDQTNNTSKHNKVAPRYSNFPAALDLTADNKPGSVDLAWTAPTIEAADGQPVTEDFEGAKSFSNKVDGWIFKDFDGHAVGGMSGIDLPGITPGTTAGSFWVWDLSQVEATGVNANSGDKMLFSMFNYDNSAVDDWAISPKLNGQAQTIKFYARSYSKDYPEHLEVWYTTAYTDDLTPADFVNVMTVSTVSNSWTEYTADIPEGATRFAIRSCAADAYMLLIDDVTFIPGDDACGAKLTGYDLYRNGQKLNDQPMTATTFNDADLTDGQTYNYVVVTVYDKGMSAPSNVASLVYSASGVEGISGGVKIGVRDRNIVVENAEGQDITVSAVDGKMMFNGQGTGSTVIPVTEGVYVVKVARKAAVKVIVR